MNSPHGQIAPVLNKRLAAARPTAGAGPRTGRSSNGIWSRFLAAALTLVTALTLAAALTPLAETLPGLGSVSSTNTITLAHRALSPLADLSAPKTASANLPPESKGESAFAAHALLIESTPAPNSSVAGPDIEIRLRFNSRVDEARSRLTLALPNHTTSRLEIHKQAVDTLTARATGLGRGAYTLQWQVLASDGHVTRGEVPFAVG